MWLGVLGPLCVRHGGAVVVVPAARQRALLAALLVQANQPVSFGELAEVVWDGVPPPGARGTLRSYVMRLRTVLGPVIPAFPLAALADELCDTCRRLDALDTGDPGSSVRAVFSWSYRLLSDPGARMFRLLGLHPGPGISIPAAASLAAVHRDQASAALHELSTAHLLTEQAPGQVLTPRPAPRLRRRAGPHHR
jgi:hypothetical protein